jgi:hypothetical protein
VKDLVGIDPMPARNLAGLQEKKDRRRVRAALVALRIAEGFPEPAALGMGLQLMGDHFVGDERFVRHFQAYLVMAGLVSAIHDCSLGSARRRGCPAQGRA